MRNTPGVSVRCNTLRLSARRQRSENDNGSLDCWQSQPRSCVTCQHDAVSVTHLELGLGNRSETGKNTYLISAVDDFARRSPTGVYDDELVWDECKTGFCDCDTYGHQFFKLHGAVPITSMMRYRASRIAHASNLLRQLPIFAHR